MHSAEAISLTLIPMTSAIISLIASTLILIMMRRSKKKLKDAYRRIVFGMSLFDIASSLAVALIIFKSTPESNMWLPLGNQTSCNILGFLHIIGSVGVPMYSVNLNIYYYYLVKRNMREKDFKKKIEPWLHGVPIAWTISGGAYVWAKKLINPSIFGGCFLSPYPVNCSFDSDDDLECIRGHNHKRVMLYYMVLPVTLCVIISAALLVAIWWKIRSQEIRMDRYRIRRVTVKMRSSLSNIQCDDDTDADGIDASDGLLKNTRRRLKNWLQRRRGMRRTASNSRGFLWAAVWYCIAFIITFAFPYIIFLVYFDGSQAPFAVKLFARLLQPLQGLFNILVYTRPHVKTCREINPNLTWFQAFRQVVASGGDDDQDHQERRRRSRRRSTLSGSVTGSSGSIRSRRHSIDNVINSNSLQRTSMFGPLRRNSSRGDMFNVEVDKNLEGMMKNKAISSSDDDKAEPLNVVTVEKISHVTAGGRRSFRLSLTSIDRQSLIRANDDANADAGANNEMHEDKQIAKSAEIARECVSASIRSEREDVQHRKNRKGSVTFAIEDIPSM